MIIENDSVMDDEMISMPNIDAYQFGRMTIGGQIYTSDLIVFPSGKVMDNWTRKKGHFLDYNDIKTLLKHKLKTIIIGTGISGRMQVDPDLLSLFETQDIGFDIHASKQAIIAYNQIIQTTCFIGAIGACFHLTC
ncbi:MAG: hypothetical protein GY699_11790 [Desulfobacteraceae bacterium]|nr:hypothetical protein [Desulfobacteraceae bacterium]